MSNIEVELLSIFGTDKDIAEGAWTSSLTKQGKTKRSDEDVARVINLLADENHSVPFEYITFKFWLRLPIAIDRQLQTHRLQSSSGMSARYRSMPTDYLDIPQDVYDILERIPKEHINNDGDTIVHGLYDWNNEYIESCENASHSYKALSIIGKQAEKDGLITNSEYKRIREFYRGVLPQHAMTERVTQMNLRSWANFIKLRNKPNAQPEIQEIARLMLEAVKDSKACPIALEALERNNWRI